MAADLQIHIRTPEVTDAVMREMFGNVIGSVYFDESGLSGQHKFDAGVYDIIARTPNVWVGSVSWLKAALFEDVERYVPDTVGAIQDLFDTPDECVTIDADFIEAVHRAFVDGREHEYYRIAEEAKVIEFLEAHKGAQAFTVSW